MLPYLKCFGRNLVNEANEPQPVVGLSEFSLFKRFTMDNGWKALVKPILDERRRAARIGGWGDRPIFIRTFATAGNNNAFAIQPFSYNRHLLRDYVNQLADEGFYSDITNGDYWDVLPDRDGPTGQQQYINETIAALVGCFCLFQLSNEPFQNGCFLNHWNVPRWGSLLIDSGYYCLESIDKWDSRQNADTISFHSPRGDDGLDPPKWLVDMNDQASYIKTAFGKFLKLEEPIGFYKNNIPGRRSNRVDYFKEMGELADECGIYFHSTIGISSDGYDKETRNAVEAFFSGASGVVEKKGA